MTDAIRYIERPKPIEVPGAKDPVTFDKFFVENVLTEIPLDDPGPSLAENINVIKNRVCTDRDSKYIALDEQQFGLMMLAVRRLQAYRGAGAMWFLFLPFILAIVGATKTDPNPKEA